MMASSRPGPWLHFHVLTFALIVAGGCASENGASSKVDSAFPDGSLSSDAGPTDTNGDPSADAGSCLGGGGRALGLTCGCKMDCESGFCADGVCCDVACNGACMTCKQPAAKGECRPVAAAAPDPHGLCTFDLPETCGQTGTCDGRGACQKYEAGTICQVSSCAAGDVVVASSSCDGQGTCSTGATRACAPFACLRGTCKLTCDTIADCSAGHPCVGGRCGKRELGEACGAASHCVSNFCADGVCCNRGCTDECMACNLTGAKGTCSAVADGSRDEQCQPSASSVCGNVGTCSDGRCKKNDGAVCGHTCSANLAHTFEKTCVAGSCSGTGLATYCNGVKCKVQAGEAICPLGCFKGDIDCIEGFLCSPGGGYTCFEAGPQ
jgi:hypothetical protein